MGNCRTMYLDAAVSKQCIIYAEEALKDSMRVSLHVVCTSACAQMKAVSYTHLTLPTNREV